MTRPEEKNFLASLFVCISVGAEVMAKRDYYEVLGVTKNSSKDEIKKAYRKLAMQFHPDRNPNNKEAETKFKEASEAAEVLLNDEKKTRYDQFGHAGVDGQAGGGFGGGGDYSDLGDIFGDIFGDFFGGGAGGGARRKGGRRGSRARAGNDLQTEISLSFEEAAFGVEKKVSVDRMVHCEPCHGKGGSEITTCDYCHGQGEIRRQQGFFMMASACPKCQGSGEMVKNPCKSCRGEGRVRKSVQIEVKIPAGIDAGQRLKLSNEGDEGTHGGPGGDLYVLVKLQEHKFFDRDGFDVYCKVPVSFSQAALGADIEVPTLSGRVAVKVPTGTQSGKKMRLKGKGIAKLGGYGIGDQIIEIQVETPSTLTAEQKKLFEQLAELDDKNSSPMRSNFFDKVKDFFQ